MSSAATEATTTTTLAARLAHSEWLGSTVHRGASGRTCHTQTWQEWASDRGLAPNPMRHLAREISDHWARPTIGVRPVEWVV